MAIGDIKLGRGSSLRRAPQVQADPSAFGEGLTRGLDRLAGGLEDAAGARARMADTLATRQNKQDRFSAEESYQRWVGQENRAQAERLRNASVDGRGITDSSNEALEASREQFLASIPESMRDEYTGRATNYVENQITSAFNFEYQTGNEFFRNTTKNTIDQAAAGILTGEISPEEARENVGNLITASDLPEIEKRQLTITAESFLAKAEFQKEMEFARLGRGTVREPTGEDVVASGLQGYERGILNAISRPESDGQYNVRYGGEAGPQTFDDFSQHPGVFVARPDGRLSSAAGRYQFTKTTWDKVAKELGLTDFSPESQDRAAIYLARQIYNKQVGAGEMTFDQVLQSGNRDAIKLMMGSLTDADGGWEGFRHMDPDEFANIVMGSSGMRGGGTGSAVTPDIWDDPRFESISFEDKNRLAGQGIRQAAAIQKAEVDARVKAETAAREAVLLGATQGDFSLEDEANLIEKGLLTTSQEVNRFRSAVNESAKGAADAARVSGLLATNGVITASDNKGLNTIIGDVGLEAIRSSNEDYAAQVLNPIVSRAGYIPSNAGKELNSMILGNNPAAQDYAATVLGQIHANDPHALERSSGISADAKRMAVLASSLRPWMTQAEIQERLVALRDPTLGSQVATMRKEARELFEETYSDSDLRSAFESRWLPGTRPDLPLDPGQAQVFRNDMKTLFVEGMLVAGDADAALTYAQEKAASQWSPSIIGGEERLMRNGPERYYESIADSYDWIDAAVREEFSLFNGEVFQLVADPQTLFEGDRYAAAEDKTGLQNASYQIMVRRVDPITGDETVSTIFRPDGDPERYAPEITQEMRDNVDRAAEYMKLDTERDAILKTAATGVVVPGALARYDELTAQMQEIEGNSPGGDPLRIVPEKSTGQLEAELEVVRERLAETELMVTEGILRPDNFLVQQDREEIRKLEEMISKRGSN